MFLFIYCVDANFRESVQIKLPTLDVSINGFWWLTPVSYFFSSWENYKKKNLALFNVGIFFIFFWIYEGIFELA